MPDYYASLPVGQWWSGLLVVMLVAGIGTLLVGVKALRDYSRAGPEIPAEVLSQFTGYAVFAFLRQCGWWFLIQVFLGLIGAILYTAAVIVSAGEYSTGGLSAAVAATILMLIFVQFCRHLLYIPSSIVMCFQYRTSRLYKFWQLLSPARLRWGIGLLLAVAALLVVLASLRLGLNGEWLQLAVFVVAVAVLAGIVVWDGWTGEPAPVKVKRRSGAPPNVVMIGCDTLRVDRLGGMGYERDLTPNIDALVNRGTLFSNCYAPLARTAPSLASMLTGLWPHRHGIRSNFVADDSTGLNCDTLPELL